ncbi:MAG TPA: thiamine pyrophosphate-dependent enzyme [Chloroflexota bacterium]|nr:thiamine pyrophosphate-dependent enzyme [Chloroflexota bacterium]
MPRIPAMDAAVKILEDEGVDFVFGIPGSNVNAFYNSLSRSKKIKHLIARHEEGASHAADGWARATGKVGVCVGTSGPAGTNFITGLYAAQADSVPIIAITGQHIRAMEGKEGFQAMDISVVAKPVTKKTYYVRDPEQIPWVFREAFRVAKEGRPGPVLIDLPIDVQRGECHFDAEIDSPLAYLTPAPDQRRIERAIQMLLEAENPVLLMGGGCVISGACETFVKLAEHLQIPVVITSMAKGGIPANHPLSAGEVGIQNNQLAANKVFLESDLVLGVGCRFADRHTGSLDVYTKGRRFIHVDIDPYQIGRIVPCELGIVSDAKLACEALLASAQAATPRRTANDRVRRIPELRQELARRVDYDQTPIKPMRVYKEINEFFDPETIFVTCIGNHQIWANQLMDVYKPGHFLFAGGAGPLGWDLPAAIGVKLAKPDNVVVNVTGDFGFPFCGEELAMAVQYNVPIVVIIVNNGYMSLIRQNQKYAYNGLNYEVGLWYNDANLIDFVKWADAFGAHAERVTNPDLLKAAFRRAVESNRPAIIDVIVERDTDVAMGNSIDAIREFEPLPERVPALR